MLPWLCDEGAGPPWMVSRIARSTQHNFLLPSRSRNIPLKLQRNKGLKHSNWVSAPGLSHYQCDALPTVPSEQIGRRQNSDNPVRTIRSKPAPQTEQHTPLPVDTPPGEGRATRPPPPHAPTGTGRLALTPAAGVPVPGRQPGVKPAPVAQLSAGERRARCWCWCCRRPWSAGPGDGRGPCSPGCAMRERARHGWCRELLGPRSTTFCCRAAVGIYLSSSSATKA